MCASEASGTYTVNGTVRWWDRDYNESGDLILTPPTFGFNPSVAPPPPPLYTQVDDKMQKSTYVGSTRMFTATVRSDRHTAAPNEIGVPVVWKLRVGRKTVKTMEQRWNRTNKLSIKLPLEKSPRPTASGSWRTARRRWTRSSRSRAAASEGGG